MKKLILLIILLISIEAKAQTPNLCGIWLSSDYNSGVAVEVIIIIQVGNSAVAIKYIGDNYVPSGFVTWFGVYNSSTFQILYTEGNGFGSYINSETQLTVVDSTYLSSMNHYTKATCQQIDSMKINLASLGVTCVCQPPPNVIHDTTFITLHDTILTTIHDTIRATELKDTCQASLVLPNIFTPNNDGKNDLFVPIEIKNVTITNFQIFNRWGNEVYQTNGSIPWNGKYRNHTVSDGVYYYIVTYKTKGGLEKAGKGIIKVNT